MAEAAKERTAACRRLFLDKVPEDFDFGSDVALGPWAFVDAGWRDGSWEHASFPEAFANTAEWVAAHRAVHRLTRHLVPTWADRLNARHGRAYSVRFWWVMLTPWLAFTTYMLWFRYRQIARLLESSNSGFATTVCTVKAWDINDVRDLVHRMQAPMLGWWFSSQAIQAINPGGWQVREVVLGQDPPPPAAPEEPTDIPSGAGRMVRSLIGRLPVDGVPGLSWQKLLLSCYVSLLPRGEPGSARHDDDATAACEFPETFQLALDKVLWSVLPRSLSADFASLEAKAKEQRYVPGRLLVGALNSMRDDRRMITALAHEHGEKLVGCQHGGWVYGYSPGIEMPPLDEMPFHAFISWGWKAQDDVASRVVPLPAPLLSPSQHRHAETSATLILVGTTMGTRGLRMNSLPTMRSVIAYRESKAAFLGELPDEIRRATLYRPYARANQDLPDEEFVLGRFPVQICRGSLDSAMKGCRLLVLDHPGTTLPIAYARNVPTICFWDPESRPLSRQSQALFVELTRAGLFLPDAASAARQVATVWHDVGAWWNSPSVTSARTAWSAEHGWGSRWWWCRWMVALARLARE